MAKITSEVEFDAQHFSITCEDGVYIFAIADNPDDPAHYIIIQYSVEVDEQDIDLGLDKEYFESSYVDGGYYGVVKNISFYTGKIRIKIEDADEIRFLTATMQNCEIPFAEMYKTLQDVHSKTGSQIELDIDQ